MKGGEGLESSWSVQCLGRETALERQPCKERWGYWTSSPGPSMQSLETVPWREAGSDFCSRNHILVFSVQLLSLHGSS